MNKKRKVYQKIITIIILLISLFGQNLLLWSINKANEAKIKVSLVNTVMDFNGYTYSGNIVYPNGEYEFYYNQWLMTDHIKDPISDGKINMPDSWVGRELHRNGKNYKLTSHGYATYRMTMTNIEPGQIFSIAKQDCGDSVKIYFNDTLVYHYGVLSKEENTNNISGKIFSQSSLVVPENGVIIMTIEVGNNGHGGLQDVPSIYPSTKSSRQASIAEAIIFFSFGIILASILTALSFLLTDRKNPSSCFILSLTIILFLTLLFSGDGLIVFNRFSIYPNYFAFEFMQYTLTALFIYIITLSEAQNNGKLTLKTTLINGLVFLTSLCSIFSLYDTPYQYVSYIILILPLLIYAYHFFSGTQENISYLNVFVLSLTIGDVLYEIIQNKIPPSFNSKGIFSVISAIRATLFIIYFIVLFFQYVKSAENYNRLYKEKIRIKENALKQQIQPHYLFNTLSVIRSLYHENMEEGDEVMAMFPKNFRQSIKNMNEEMIPFEREIETINQYIELENKRFSKPFDLILDLDFVNFMVPPLTIEPIVENSVNYSKVNEKDDGFISISSSFEEGNVVIVINDNGIGYDTSKTKSTSIGQKNLIERLHLNLNAEIKIESSLGNGTKTTIVFPYEGKALL